jgi:hypothetical protein
MIGVQCRPVDSGEKNCQDSDWKDEFDSYPQSYAQLQHWTQVIASVSHGFTRAKEMTCWPQCWPRMAADDILRLDINYLDARLDSCSGSQSFNNLGGNPGIAARRNVSPYVRHTCARAKNSLARSRRRERFVFQRNGFLVRYSTPTPTGPVYGPGGHTGGRAFSHRCGRLPDFRVAGKSGLRDPPVARACRMAKLTGMAD